MKKKEKKKKENLDWIWRGLVDGAGVWLVGE